MLTRRGVLAAVAGSTAAGAGCIAQARDHELLSVTGVTADEQLLEADDGVTREGPFAAAVFTTPTDARAGFRWGAVAGGYATFHEFDPERAFVTVFTSPVLHGSIGGTRTACPEPTLEENRVTYHLSLDRAPERDSTAGGSAACLAKWRRNGPPPDELAIDAEVA